MKSSKYDGQRVLHVDGGANQHSGVIVGQSDDGARYYVQSDNPRVPRAAWHFVVNAAVLPVLLKNARRPRS